MPKNSNLIKAISFPFIAFMLIFSILAPSILPLLDKDCDLVVLADTNDEKKGKEKESEKKFDEKNLFLDQAVHSNDVHNQKEGNGDIAYRFSILEFHTEIILPPPRKLV